VVRFHHGKSAKQVPLLAEIVLEESDRSLVSHNVSFSSLKLAAMVPPSALSQPSRAEEDTPALSKSKPTAKIGRAGYPFDSFNPGRRLPDGRFSFNQIP
jgi:hypothetical protein